VYILGDEQICGQTLQMLRSFLHTFKADWAASELSNVCVKKELLICKQIRGELQTSAMHTSVFGFLAAVFFLPVVDRVRNIAH